MNLARGLRSTIMMADTTPLPWTQSFLQSGRAQRKSNQGGRGLFTHL